MGQLGLEMDGIKSKYTVSRKRFIEWVAMESVDLLTPLEQVKADLIGCGEHIIEAQVIFDQFEEIPSFLLMEKIEDKFVRPRDCVLSFIQE